MKRISIFIISCILLTGYQLHAQSLVQCIQENNVQGVKDLLKKNPQLAGEQDQNGVAGLHYAAGYGNVDIVNLLLQNGADPNAQTLGGSTPMMIAARYSRSDIIEILVNTGAQLQLKDRAGNSVFSIAVEYESTNLIDKLLELGYQLDYQSDDARNLLHLMARTGNKKMTKQLIKKIPEPGIDQRGRNLLANSVIGGLNHIIKDLGKQIESINHLDSLNRNALHYASLKGNAKAVKQFLNSGATISQKDQYGKTPLDLAYYSSDQQTIELLLNQDAPASEKDLFYLSESVFEKKSIPTLPDNYLTIKYIANEGFLIHNQKDHVLVDAIHGDKNGVLYNRTPLDVFEKMLAKDPPFQHIDLCLVSHWHQDHVNFDMLAHFLQKHKETTLITGAEEVKQLSDYLKISHSKKNIIQVDPPFEHILDVSESPLPLSVFSTNHGPAGLDVTTTAFLFELGGINLLHLGDLVPEVNAKLLQKLDFSDVNVDIAFMDPYFLQSEIGQAFIKEKVQPKLIILMHVGDNDREANVQRLSGLYPDLLVFNEANEEKYFVK